MKPWMKPQEDLRIICYLLPSFQLFHLLDTGSINMLKEGNRNFARVYKDSCEQRATGPWWDSFLQELLLISPGWSLSRACCDLARPSFRGFPKCIADCSQWANFLCSWMWGLLTRSFAWDGALLENRKQGLIFQPLNG